MSKTKADVVLSNLAQLDSKETTDAMQAFFNQFNLGTKNVEKDAMMISDSMVAISKSMAMNFSQGIREMIEGVKTSGSVAKNAGFDLQHYEALIGTVAQVTRASGSEIGNAWKNILSRMGAVKPTTKKAAQDINKVEQSLKGVGVQLRSDKNTFRNAQDVLDDLSKKWGNLSQVQKAAIAEQMAGKMQINKFYALMDNYGKYTELATKATHSQGEAMKANEIYLQSTEAKMKLLTNAMQEFFGAALKSNDLKVLIEMLTDIIHVATVVVDKFGLLGTVAGIMSAKMIMSSNGFKNLISTFKETQSASSALKTAFNGFENSIKVDNIKASFDNVKKSLSEVSVESQKTKNNIAKGLQDGTISIQKFDRNAKMIPKRMEEITRSGNRLGVVKTAIRNIGGETTRTTSKIYLLGKAFDVARIKATLFQAVASMGISLAIGAIVGGIGKLISKAHEGKQSLNDMVSTLSDNMNKTSSLEVMANKMDYLSNKTNRNVNEQKQLEQIQQQIAQQNPSLITGYDSQGRAIANNSKAVHDLVKEKRNLLEADLQSTISKTAGKIDSETAKYKSARKRVNELSKELNNHKEVLRKLGYNEKEVQNRTKGFANDLKNEAKQMRDSKNVIDQYNSASKACARLQYDDAKAVINSLNAHKKKKATIEEVKKALEDQNIDSKAAEQALRAYANGTLNAADGNKDMKGSVDDANQSLAEQGDKLAGLNGKVETYKKILQEFKDNDGNLTRSTLDQIIQKNQELLPLLKDKAHFEENMKKAIDDTGKAHDQEVQKIIQGSGSIKDALADIADTAKQKAGETGNEVSKIAQQTSDNVKNSSADASNNISNDSANTKGNVTGDMDETSKTADDTGNNISDTSKNTSDNVSNDSSNTKGNVTGDMDDTANKAGEAGGSITDTASNTSGNVLDLSDQTAQGMVDGIDGAVTGMGEAYATDVNNFQNACNAKINLANATAQQIAAAFNAVTDQMAAAAAVSNGSGSYVDHNMNLKFTSSPEPTFREAQDAKYKSIMADWGKAAKAPSRPHIDSPHIDPVGIAGGGYSPQGSSHSAGGGRHRGNGGSGGGGRRSPRHTSGGGGSGSGRHKNGSSDGGSRGTGSSKGSSGGSSETKKEVENLNLEIDRYKLVNAEIARINEKLNRTKDLKEQAKGKEKVNFINQEVKETNELIDAQKRLQSEQDKQRNELKDKLAKNWFSFNKDGSIKDYQGSLKKLEDWANKATGDQKEKRIQLVKDLQKDADSYIELVSNKIPEVDNAIFKSTSNIKELLKQATKVKMDDFKKDFDNLIDGIQEKAKGLDVSEAMFGDKSYENNLDFLKHRINLADKEFQAKFKYLNQLKQLSKDSGQKDFDELNQAIKDANDSLDDGKIKVQQLREQYEKLNLEWKQSAFDDFKWQTQQKFDALDLSISKLTDSNTVGKINLLNEKLQLQQTSLKRTEQYIKQLRNTVVHTARGYEELIEKLKAAEEELNNQKNAVVSLEKEMEGLVNDRISKYIDQIHKIEQLQLERKQKEEQLALEKDFFGISESKFEAYRNSRINALNEEIDLLRRKYEIEGAEPQILDEIKAKSIELRDIQRQQYQDIGKELGDWKKLHEEMYKQKIELIDKELKAMDEQDKAEQEKEERLKRQNELLKIQEQMLNIKKNHNIRELQKGKDGQWQFSYTYDRQALDKATEDYKQKQEDLQKWEKDLARNKLRDQLQKQKDDLQKAMDDLNNIFDSKKGLLDKVQDQERELLEKKYEDMDSLTQDYMNKLKSTYGNNWNGMLSDMDSKLNSGKEILKKFNDEIVSQVSQSQAKIKDLMDSLGGMSAISNNLNLNFSTPVSFASMPIPQANNFNTMKNIHNEETKQYITVQASFPNVNNSSEIENAFRNLSNDSIQYINKR